MTMHSKKYVWLYPAIIACAACTFQAQGNPNTFINIPWSALITKAHTTVTNITRPIAVHFSRYFLTYIHGAATQPAPNTQEAQAPRNIRLQALLTATVQAFKKITRPFTAIPVNNLMHAVQNHPKATIFSIFGTAAAGLLLHTIKKHQHNIQALETEELERMRQERQEIGEQIAQTQQAIATAAAQEEAQRRECETLKQKVTLLQKLAEQFNKDRDATLNKAFQILESLKSDYLKEIPKLAKRIEELLAKKAHNEKRFEELKTQIVGTQPEYHHGEVTTQNMQPLQQGKYPPVAYPPQLLGAPNTQQKPLTSGAKTEQPTALARRTPSAGKKPEDFKQH